MTKEQLEKITKDPKITRSGFEFTTRAADTEEKKMIIEGYALKFNNETIIGTPDYGYREVIVKGALDTTDMKKVPMKYNHESSYLAMASTKNGSLKLTVDDVGLRFEAELIDTEQNKDVFKAVKSGLLNECSFAFTLSYPGGSEWIWPENPKELPIRQIKKIDRLFDIALVDIPAYDNTSANARSFEELEDAKKAVEAEKLAASKKADQRRRMEMLLKIENGGIKQ